MRWDGDGDDGADDGDGVDDDPDDAWRRSEEHTSELQSHYSISYAVFCWKKTVMTVLMVEMMLMMIPMMLGVMAMTMVVIPPSGREIPWQISS